MLGFFIVDVDYMAFAILMGVFGIVGITATANVTPNIFASATCNCVPSPEARLQELSVMLLAFSGVLIPIGLARKNSGRDTLTGQRGRPTTGSGRVYMPPSMRSPGLLTLGASLVVLGVALVAVPAFLANGNPLLIGEGAATAALGLLLARYGGKAN